MNKVYGPTIDSLAQTSLNPGGMARPMATMSMVIMIGDYQIEAPLVHSPKAEICDLCRR